MSQPIVWIIEDDASIRWILNKALEKLDVAVSLFDSAEPALAALNRETPDTVLTDIRMPGQSGIAFLQKFKQQHADIPVIVMTAFSDLETTVKAFKNGAFDYLTKPFNIDDALSVVEQALIHHQQQRPDTSPVTADTDHRIIGDSPQIQKIFTAIGRLSHTDINVLIAGESGTGKELVAQALFENSPRHRQPFITINTAAIPIELLESELFGHEKGAFTGATARRLGRFEQANHGTLFLDEIGDMPLALQTRLLRVLQDGRYYRVGGHQLIESDVRVIAATNQNLAELVRLGKFREDLYHRLNVVQIELPPLRERNADIPMLVNYFLAKQSQDMDIEPKHIAADALGLLAGYHWPGNIRELENTCRRLMVMSPGKTIQTGDLPDILVDTQKSESGHSPGEDWQAQFVRHVTQSLAKDETNLSVKYGQEMETLLYNQVLAFTGGHKINAAKILGISRNTITRKINELDLES